MPAANPKPSPSTDPKPHPIPNRRRATIGELRHVDSSGPTEMRLHIKLQRIAVVHKVCEGHAKGHRPRFELEASAHATRLRLGADRGHHVLKLGVGEDSHLEGVMRCAGDLDYLVFPWWHHRGGRWHHRSLAAQPRRDSTNSFRADGYHIGGAALASVQDSGHGGGERQR